MVYLPVFFFIEIFLQWEKKHPEPLQNTPRTVQNRPEHTQNRPEPPQNRPEHTQNTPEHTQKICNGNYTMEKKTLLWDLAINRIPPLVSPRSSRERNKADKGVNS